MFLLDVPEEYFRRFRDRDRLECPIPSAAAPITSTTCAARSARRDYFPGVFAWKAWRFHVACRQVYAVERPDVSNSSTTAAWRDSALSAKAAGLDYRHSHLAIRLHNSIEMMDLHEAAQPLSFERYILYAWNTPRCAWPRAFSILRIPTCEKAAGRITKSGSDGPSVRSRRWSFGRKRRRPDPHPQVGSRRMPRTPTSRCSTAGSSPGKAWISTSTPPWPILKIRPTRLQFYLVGNDSGQPPINAPDYRSYLLRKIPRKHRESFVFTGWLAWNDFAGTSAPRAFRRIPLLLRIVLLRAA